jgi:fucose 4-O-acetylase-like acetyltransferase
MINNTAKKRECTPDLIRGIAVLLMIQVHITELFARQSIYDSFSGKVLLFLGGPLVAPLFVGIMGYFLAKSTKNLKCLLRRGALLFGGGILLNIGFNFNLLVKAYHGHIDVNPFDYVFGCDILPLAGLSVIVIGLLRELFRGKYILYVLTAFAIATVGAYLPPGSSERSVSTYVFAFFGGEYSWSYFPFFPWAAYPIMGYAVGLILQKYSFKKKTGNLLRLFIYSISGIIVVITWDFGFTISSKLTEYYHHDIIYYLWVFALAAAYIPVCELIIMYAKNQPFIKFLRWVGKNVTTVYVIQWLIIGNTATMIYKTQNVFQMVLWFVVVVAITSLLTYFLEKQLQKNKKKIST